MREGKEFYWGERVLQNVTRPVTRFSTRDLLIAYSVLSQIELQQTYQLLRALPTSIRESC